MENLKVFTWEVYEVIRNIVSRREEASSVLFLLYVTVTEEDLNYQLLSTFPSSVSAKCYTGTSESS